MVWEAYFPNFTPLWMAVQSDSNDVYLCRRKDTGTQCLVWIIRDRAAVRMLLGVKGRHPWQEWFPAGEHMGMTLPWEVRRPLKKFWGIQGKGGGECRRICREIVSMCMTSQLPYPLLYRALEEDMINIRKDGALYFSYGFSLDGLRHTCTEQDCVQACVRILLEILAGGDKKENRLMQLLEKKLDRKRYRTFLELYRDLRRPQKRRRKKKWRLSERWKKRFFRTAAVCAGILAVFILIMLVSQLVLGRIPFLNIFGAPLNQIGTETLGRMFL